MPQCCSSRRSGIRCVITRSRNVTPNLVEKGNTVNLRDTCGACYYIHPGERHNHRFASYSVPFSLSISLSLSLEEKEEVEEEEDEGT